MAAFGLDAEGEDVGRITFVLTEGTGRAAVDDHSEDLAEGGE